MGSMAGAAFRWLELLEQEFDTAYVRLDTAVGEFDVDDPEAAYAVRQRMTALSSCFAQLSHKAQTIFQNSAKVEAELINLRTELIDARAFREAFEQQRSSLDGGPEFKNVSVGETVRLRSECSQLYRENNALRATVLALHSEVYGARLAAKYLDKELAGRIQQLQLLGREMKGEVRDRLWRQLESEILLQRHKTVVRACRSARGSGAHHPHERQPSIEGRIVTNEPRQVAVPRAHQQGLGISITGGREHGVPILISELEADGPAAQTGQLYVGDAILSVNNIDLRHACHKEAVNILQNQTGDCTLCVQFVAEESEDENFISEDEYTFKYPIFPTDDGAAACEATPTAPRTPDPAHIHRRSGSEDFSDYLITPDKNHLEKSCQQYNNPESYYNDLSPALYDNSYSTFNRGEYYPVQKYSMMMQDSILDMDDNTIKIQTDVVKSAAETDFNLRPDQDSIDNNLDVSSSDHNKYEILQKHIVITDNSNPSDAVNNSLSNSGSAGSPILTSSDNNIVSSGISCGNIDISNSGDSKSPSEPTDIINGNSVTQLDCNIKNSKEKHIAGEKMKSALNKNSRFKSNVRKKSSDKAFEVNHHISSEDNAYDKNNDINQNVGFSYPKISNLKSFMATNQYLGVSGNSMDNYESSLSPDSVETTPVHGRKTQNKIIRKKRTKANDWKNKGIYQALDNINTSDMDSPNRVVKPDKNYYKEGDSLAKIGVKTIQSIFEKSMKEEKASIYKSNKELSSAESNDALCEKPFSAQNVAGCSERNLSLVEAPLVSLTPEHPVRIPKSENNFASSGKQKEGLAGFANVNEMKSGRNVNIAMNFDDDTKRNSLPNCATSSRFNLKSREFRVGSAKRIPPPPDVIHIPLKETDIECAAKSDAKLETSTQSDMNIAVSLESHKPPNPILKDSCQQTQTSDDSSDAEANANSPPRQQQTEIETEINDIYPVLEDIINSSNASVHGDVDIDATLKLALSKLDMSILSEDFASSSMSPSNTDTVRSSKKKYERGGTSSSKAKTLSKHDVLPKYVKDIIIEGNGDPDFGTPV